MPVAKKFEAEEVDNGFPFCLQTIDVTSTIYPWTTLSGWSKINEPVGDAAKEQSIQDSLRLAMSLFWNVSELTGEASTTTELYGPSIVTSSGEVTTEPKDRVCSASIEQLDTDGPSQSLSKMGIGFKPARIVKDSSLIGYGIALSGAQGGTNARAQASSSGASSDAQVILLSLGFAAPTSTIRAEDYTTVLFGTETFHFVCSVLAFPTGANAVATKDPANKYAYAEGTRRRSGVDVVVCTSEAELDTFDFYTYP